MASPAQAFASKVFPVPGGPESKAPFGMFAPIFLYFYGCFKKSTNSTISFLAYYKPATSLNFIFDIIGLNFFILLSNYIYPIELIPI